MTERHEFRSHRAIDAVIGSISLFTGVALTLTVVAVRLEGLGDLPTGLIRRNPVIMVGFGLLLILGGAQLLWRNRCIATRWTPSRPGRRFRAATLFTRPDCPLCEEARSVLAAYQPYLPDLQIVDISDDPALQSKYDRCVPVVELDGRRRFIGQVNEVLLRRLIEGTPPVDASGGPRS